MDTTEENQEFGFHNKCISCGAKFKLIKTNVIRCMCTTKFFPIDKIIQEYQDKYLVSYTKH